MQKEKVIIELSGGVDSSVAAYLLKQRGYEVIGVTFTVWRLPNDCSGGSRPAATDKNCCDEESVIYAKRVADYLGIPHYSICLKDIFYEKVVKDFIDKYKMGLTPNPCVKCNEYIKFNALAEKMNYLAPFKIATGHYARIIYNENVGTGRDLSLLYKGVDPKKDQSYFLYCLKQEALKNILFPLGELTKEKVRQIAKREKLPTHAKPESQEVCFVPDADYKKFFDGAGIAAEPGPVYDTGGKKIGAHFGIFNYTIGQRRGLGISSDKPLYVISINAKSNSIVLGESSDLLTNKVSVSDINWISQNDPLTLPSPQRGEGMFTQPHFSANVKIRYNMKEQLAEITLVGEDKVEILFEKPVRAATPGQSAVFYDGDEVLGGGVIEMKMT